MARQWQLRVGHHTDEQFWFGKNHRQSVQQTMAASNNARRPPVHARRNAAKSTTPKPRPNEKLDRFLCRRIVSNHPQSEVTLRFSAPEDAPLWIDGKSMPFANRKKMELDAGRHDLVFQLNPRTLPEFIRAQCDQAVFLVD